MLSKKIFFSRRRIYSLYSPTSGVIWRPSFPEILRSCCLPSGTPSSTPLRPPPPYPAPCCSSSSYTPRTGSCPGAPFSTTTPPPSDHVPANICLWVGFNPRTRKRFVQPYTTDQWTIGCCLVVGLVHSLDS